MFYCFGLFCSVNRGMPQSYKQAFLFFYIKPPGSRFRACRAFALRAQPLGHPLNAWWFKRCLKLPYLPIKVAGVETGA